MTVRAVDKPNVSTTGGLPSALDAGVEGTATLHKVAQMMAVVSRMNGTRTLPETLQAVVEGVVHGIGFGTAVVNYVLPDGRIQVVAVAGPEDVRHALLGQMVPDDLFTNEFALAESWGELCYVPHYRSSAMGDATWVPNIPIPSDPEGWHPLDALYAPLYSPAHELVGILSVDLPPGGTRPDTQVRLLLELFAAQAGVAINNARLAEALELERSRLAASEESFRLAFDGAGIPMALVSLDPVFPLRHLRVNDAFAALSGYPRGALLAGGLALVLDQSGRKSRLDDAIRTSVGPLREDTQVRRADGSHVWVSLTASLLSSAGTDSLSAIIQMEDITARKQSESALSRAARQDVLTGLPNRAAVHDRIAEAIARSRASGRPGAVLFCDLDHFKSINDELGHEAGDAALLVVASRIVEQVRASDLVGRLGGDEFVIVVEDTQPGAAAALAWRITHAIREPATHRGQEMELTVSVGIAHLTPDSGDVDAVLRSADKAMYRVKAVHGTEAGDPGRQSPS
jgi:diguanylate cyclase (GGDEF)-like protein/PAS domain S-box-containing protein